MPKAPKRKWTFAARFRRNAFGWRSQPASKRVREAVSEIKKARRKDPFLAALKGAQRILVVEQTHSGQFHDYLRAKCDLPGEVRHFIDVITCDPMARNPSIDNAIR